MKKALYLIVLLVNLQLFAQEDQMIRLKHFNLPSNHVAIKGYDPVAYFLSNKAIKGKSDIAISHKGIIYNFSTYDNLLAFKKEPAKYEPQYGGWCAYAMGNSIEKVEIDPETFKILNGKLYLFYNKFFTNTLTLWNKNEQVLFKKAEKSWNQFVEAK
jgi:YHS domain-containing protein